jgi:integrase
MAKGRISKRSVDALHCKSKQDRAFLWDDALSGFGVAAFPSGKKVFVAQFRQNGRSRRIALGEYGRLTPDEARSGAKKVLGAVEDGADPIQERRDGRAMQTFKDLADEFMRLHVATKRRGRTGDEYERLLASYIFPAIGPRRLSDVRRVDVARLHAEFSDRPPTANRCLAIISAVWNWGAKRDQVKAADNPAKGIERNAEQGKERYLSTDELARLGDAIRRGETEGLPWNTDEAKPTSKHLPKGPHLTLIDAHAAAALRLLILTGARLREILTAKWDYIDWERGIMLLPDSKTGKKTIYLSAAALAVLKSIPRTPGTPYIVPGEKRRPKPGEAKPAPSPRADLKRPWAAIAKAAGFEDVRLHDLRHSFASMGAGASLGLPIIGKLLGHSQPATTARYSHLDADPMRRAADIIGNQITAVMAGRALRLSRSKRGGGRAERGYRASKACRRRVVSLTRIDMRRAILRCAR